MGVVKNTICRPLNYTEQNGYLKILIRCVFGIYCHGRGGGLFPSNHFQLIKRALALSISNRTSIFRSFYDSDWPSQNFYQMHYSYSHSFNEIAVIALTNER